jgi:transcriptional regulator with XRE-family HTH domain
MANIYNRIRLRREELGLSQEELAKRMGYKSRSSINKIELGENDIPQSKIAAFADVLHTTVPYLMGVEEPKEPDQDTLPSFGHPDLGPEENQLISLYRALSDNGKRELMFYAKIRYIDETMEGPVSLAAFGGDCKSLHKSKKDIEKILAATEEYEG